jgi:hypothetical protein
MKIYSKLFFVFTVLFTGFASAETWEEQKKRLLQENGISEQEYIQNKILTEEYGQYNTDQIKDTGYIDKFLKIDKIHEKLDKDFNNLKSMFLAKYPVISSAEFNALPMHTQIAILRTIAAGAVYSEISGYFEKDFKNVASIKDRKFKSCVGLGDVNCSESNVAEFDQKTNSDGSYNFIMIPYGEYKDCIDDKSTYREITSVAYDADASQNCWESAKNKYALDGVVIEGRLSLIEEEQKICFENYPKRISKQIVSNCAKNDEYEDYQIVQVKNPYVDGYYGFDVMKDDVAKNARSFISVNYAGKFKIDDLHNINTEKGHLFINIVEHNLQAMRKYENIQTADIAADSPMSKGFNIGDVSVQDLEKYKSIAGVPLIYKSGNSRQEFQQKM